MFLVVLLVLLVMAMGGRFIGYLQEAAAGKFNAGSLLLLLGYRLPEFAQLLLPFSLFTAVVLTLGRCYADQELTVLQSGGLGPYRLVGWLLPLILLVTAVVAWCALDLNPRLQRLSYALLQAERANRDFANLRPGVFHIYSRGDRVSYADALDDSETMLQQVFLSERRGPRESVTVRAQTGRQYLDGTTGSRFLLLRNGSRTEGVIGEGAYRVIDFERMGQRIELAERPDPELRATQQDTAALVATLGMPDIGGPALAELGYRSSLPALTLVVGLLAVGLSPVKPREGRFSRMPLALLVFIGYYLALVLQKDLVGSGSWPPALAYWPAHALFFALALFGLARLGRPRGA